MTAPTPDAPNRDATSGQFSDPSRVVYTRCTVNLADETVSFADVRCRNLEDVLGGFGRSFQMLAVRDVTDAFSDANPLIVNTGILTGTNVMTGLRTYFSAYSPLKVSGLGLPAAMWSAGSRKVRLEAQVGRRRRHRCRTPSLPPSTPGDPGDGTRLDGHTRTGGAPLGPPLLSEDPGDARHVSGRTLRRDRARRRAL